MSFFRRLFGRGEDEPANAAPVPAPTDPGIAFSALGVPTGSPGWADMDHPVLGPLRFITGQGVWLGATRGGHEVIILGDFFEDVPDAECEAMAVRELADLDGLLARIESFLATVREPYLDRWASRRWEVSSLVFAREEDRPTFIAEYLLERDDYVVWQVRVEDGLPVALGRRS